MFSILILTYNEENNLPECLQSVAGCDDIVVLDSLSSDSTVRIAEGTPNVRVVHRAFTDFADQRNYALEHANFKHEWVFHLDADEHFSTALREECEAMIHRDEKSGYQVPSKMMLWGRWLKHSAAYPVYQMRFHKRTEVRFEQYGHGQRECDALRGIGFLKEPYEHHSFGNGLNEWFERHNRYSEQEAQRTVESLKKGSFNANDLFTTNRLARRRALKELSFRLPCRPLLRFLYQYLIKLGFLDGAPGLSYCLMQALYETQISLKVTEQRMRKKGIPC